MKLKEILRIAQDKKLGSWHCEILLDDERAEVERGVVQPWIWR